jgi:hypothetical protein
MKEGIMAGENQLEAFAAAMAAAPVPQQAKASFVTAEEFITKAPLYVKNKVDGFSAPASISFDCYGECKKETTWYRTHYDEVVGKGSGGSDQVADWSLRSVAYKCFKCGKASLTVIYRETGKESRQISPQPATGIPRNVTTPPSTTQVLVDVMKVGQYPALSISIPKALEQNLGKDAAELYRKAIISRNNGYGLASAVYTRRVVEDKTNELIQVAADLAESHGIDADVVSKIRAAGNSADYTPYDEKLKIAGAVFPDSLKVGDFNPLKTLYGLVSEGIHGMSEEKCIEVADNTAFVFSYVFTNLKAQIADRKTFIEHVKKLS